MIIAHNGTCTNNCGLPTDIRIARETGYDGIEIIGSKLYSFLDQGRQLDVLIAELDGFPAVALGYVQDIERADGQAHQDLLAECEKMCDLAAKLNCPMVQILTGPIGPGIGEGVPPGYEQIMEMPWPQLRKTTARSIASISEVARKHNVDFYLEALSWAPIHSLSQMLELIDESAADNVGVLIDFWHLFTSGSTPDDIAKLDKRIIKGVHVCDSVRGDGSSHDDREIWTGGGIIPQKQWLDAVLATGYDGWFSCELFSHKHWELDPRQTARLLQEQLRYLLL